MVARIGIDIGPEAMTRHAGKALNIKHAQGRNSFPLGKSLRRNLKAGRELVAEPASLDRRFQAWMFISHGPL